MADELRHGYVAVEPGVRLHYVEQGQGPLVVLLHGFPEFWYSWRFQLPALGAAGFRVVAPDLRGYNLSDKPRGLAAYRTSVLARDVARLVEALSSRPRPASVDPHTDAVAPQTAAVVTQPARVPQRASVVGHDWGGGVAWTFAMRYPHLLDKLAILNAPHPAVFLAHLLGNPRQLRKSWYIFFFQLPWLPEALLRANNFGAVRRQLAAPEYLEALRQPGALTAAINYYRAMFRGGRAALRGVRTPVTAPVLVIWGQNDRFLGPELAAPEPPLAPRARVERIAGASHWVQLDKPERVNSLLVGFLSEA